MPKEFSELRRQIEGRLGKHGRREYVQVLQLLAIAFDAVKQLVLCAIEQRPPKLDLENYPHLPVAEVALTRGGRLSGATGGNALMDTPQVLVGALSETTSVPTMVREYRKLGEQCTKEDATFEVFLLQLVESEIDRERRATERRIKAAKFPVSRSLKSYNFLDMPTLNKKLVNWHGASGSAGGKMSWP